MIIPLFVVVIVVVVVVAAAAASRLELKIMTLQKFNLEIPSVEWKRIQLSLIYSSMVVGSSCLSILPSHSHYIGLQLMPSLNSVGIS